MRAASLRRLLAATAATALLSAPAAFAHGGPGGHRPPGSAATATGSGGAAASVDALGTRAAIDTLRHGGNAIDAAVTAAGVLGVVEPFSCGLGGGGFMVIRTADGQVTTIDGRETAPAAMRPDSFIEDGQALPFIDARFSGLSAGVPGTPDTWVRALRRYGTISLHRALQPGIRVARRGFTIDDTFYGQVDDVKDYFDDVPSTARIYLDRDGTPHDVGTVQRNPELARAYRRFGRLGHRGFYRGPIARALVRAARRPPITEDAEHTWRPGLMTRRDMRAYHAPEREPTHVSYRGLDVWGMGPPSSGGSTVGEALNILEGYRPLGATTEEALHRYLEASRYAFGDRGAYLADPAYFDVPLDGLLSDSFAAERRALITGTAAQSPVGPGDPYDNEGDPGLAAKPGAQLTRTGSTTHLTVADAEGNVVSYTFTIEQIGGNGVVVPGWGFLLNNELTDFDYSTPDAANAPAGGKRPRSSMAPTIVTRDGRPFLALGSPGGSTIITTVLQILIERLDLGMTLPEAIAAPRLSQRNTETTAAEPAFLASPEAAALRARGHVFAPMDEIGAATGIEQLDRGRLLAAAEPDRRGGGTAMVVRP